MNIHVHTFACWNKDCYGLHVISINWLLMSIYIPGSLGQFKPYHWQQIWLLHRMVMMDFCILLFIFINSLKTFSKFTKTQITCFLHLFWPIFLLTRVSLLVRKHGGNNQNRVILKKPLPNCFVSSNKLDLFDELSLRQLSVMSFWQFWSGGISCCEQYNRRANTKKTSWQSKTYLF